ncbi:kinase [Cricetid gammaherpesvirus 2]|uniref:Kinase n=1 Tax=Cricetid gammaherpesvirus 2 TaxID=1605972 RepID=E9M5M0_9GAMA|nr:kinase [Cricetid gammaherpesvirus 2]ADW24378.1 kinase [Cricetid gammaherpesvirus 2]ADW24460.1 kinase [Cricetid gammaherpesvirus 2]
MATALTISSSGESTKSLVCLESLSDMDDRPGPSNAARNQRPQQMPRNDEPSIIDHMLWQKDHVSMDQSCLNVISFKIPAIWTSCKHPKLPTGHQLGRGGYGSVSTVANNPGMCVKKMSNSRDFFSEAVIMDVVEVSKRNNSDHAGVRNIVGILGVCSHCKVIMYPRYRCSLDKFILLPNMCLQLINGFQGLMNAVEFLNVKCGFTHCDISPSNILVGNGGVANLILGDMGVCVITGNPANYPKIIIRTKNGRNVGSVKCTICPEYTGKCEYRPAFLLFMNYDTAINGRSSDFHNFSPTRSQGLLLDKCSLLCTFLESLIMLAGKPYRYLQRVINDNPPPDEGAKVLCHLMQRECVASILSCLTYTKFHIGLDPKRGSTYIKLSKAHSTYFSNLCSQGRHVLYYMLDREHAETYRHPMLRTFLLQFNSLDKFKPLPQ